jgi:phosphate transport system substrate-binding protein
VYENVLNNTYPLSRYLNLYIVQAPGKEIEPLRREFIKYIFSKEGQEVVVKDGYDPLPAKLAADELRQLGIEIEVSTNP